MKGPPRSILGIDTALRHTGYGLIHVQSGSWSAAEFGCWNPGRTVSKLLALRRLYEEMIEFLRTRRPDVVVLEGIFFARDARSALSLGESRGVILLACAMTDTDVFEYAPREVKRAVTGRGQADKSQVSRMVASILGLSEPPEEDAADALALALCHALAGSGPLALQCGRYLGPARTFTEILE